MQAVTFLSGLKNSPSGWINTPFSSHVGGLQLLQENSGVYFYFIYVLTPLQRSMAGHRRGNVQRNVHKLDISGGKELYPRCHELFTYLSLCFSCRLWYRLFNQPDFMFYNHLLNVCVRPVVVMNDLNLRAGEGYELMSFELFLRGDV